MKFSKKQLGYALALCTLSFTCISLPVHATEEKELQSQSNELKEELNTINQDIQTLASDIAESEVAIEETDGEIEKTQELLLIAQSNEQKQYEDMKDRIKYLYENDTDNFLSLIFGAEDMDDLLNKVDFVQTVNSYDRKMLTELTTLKETIASQQEHLESEQTSQKEQQAQLTEKKAALTAKAKETSTDLNEINKEIEQLKEQQRKEAEEKARKEAEEAAKKKAAEEEAKKKAAEENNKKVEEANKAEKKSKKTTKKETTKTTETEKKTTTQKKSSSTSDVSKNDKVSSNSGGLTKNKGVVYYNGHRETYYSQKVLPGNGLKIPGRHVASDGTIRDENGYICVASSDLPKGTVVQTSLGPGKVYDSGCASGTIDLYTNW